ncbi:MAG: hypothetical protein E7254_08565 [Lachnospiraceae bacterium]|nr:hypothetical protein [Lachnospiraceae bacterium]
MRRYSTKSYKGQDGTDYGSIYDPEKYLEDRYNCKPKKIEENILDMDEFVCGDFEQNSNCSLVAITRILTYYAKHGYDNISDDYRVNYEKVLKNAKTHGFNEKKGTHFYKIDNIIREVFADYGYRKVAIKSRYIWGFKSEVKNEINANRPVIMNIAMGQYEDHTITVCGYVIYQEDNTKKKHRMICVHDAWKRTVRYIDYEAFAYSFIKSGIGSFNLIRIKNN